MVGVGRSQSRGGPALTARRKCRSRPELKAAPAPRVSANGSLTHYITHSETKKFQPANITFDLLPPLEDDLRKKMRDKKERHRIQCERALAAWTSWLKT